MTVIGSGAFQAESLEALVDDYPALDFVGIGLVILVMHDGILDILDLVAELCRSVGEVAMDRVDAGNQVGAISGRGALVLALEQGEAAGQQFFQACFQPVAIRLSAFGLDSSRGFLQTGLDIEQQQVQ